MNGDGTKDLITGHYWPGDIHIFYGKKDGSFEPMKYLKDETGRNLNAGPVWKDENEPQMQSLAAAPYAADWDGDGEFASGDLVAAFIEGGYERGPRRAPDAAVPEPASFLAFALGLLSLLHHRRNVRS